MTDLFKCSKKSGTTCCAPKSRIHEVQAMMVRNESVPVFVNPQQSQQQIPQYMANNYPNNSPNNYVHNYQGNYYPPNNYPNPPNVYPNLPNSYANPPNNYPQPPQQNNYPPPPIPPPQQNNYINAQNTYPVNYGPNANTGAGSLSPQYTTPGISILRLSIFYFYQ